jgi:VIT1/CCC1 family predicted Fe2+/Mn2+ transporter
MINPFRTGACFGITSGIITTLGLMVGLDAGTNSKLAVIGGILTIAVADAFSDSLSLHVSQESQCKLSTRNIWESALSTFWVKFFVTLTFAIPVLLLSLSTAVGVSIVWGVVLLGTLSIFIAESRKENAWRVVSEHLVIALAVIVLTRLIGQWIAATFL